jgi:flagellar protein FlgJ
MPLEPVTPPNLPQVPPGLAGRLARLAEGARAGQEGARTELRQACEMLEAHFVTWLLREMRQTVPHEGLLPYGPTEETYDELLDDSLAKAVARGGGIGLARSLETQLARRSLAPPKVPRLAGPAVATVGEPTVAQSEAP